MNLREEFLFFCEFKYIVSQNFWMHLANNVYHMLHQVWVFFFLGERASLTKIIYLNGAGGVLLILENYPYF
jgi:hypothetical protein